MTARSEKYGTIRKSRKFGNNEYVEYEHFYFKNQADRYLKEKRDQNYHVRMTESKIQINSKPHPYFIIWMLKSEYLKWKDDFDRSMYGKHYDIIKEKRGYTGHYNK